MFYNRRKIILALLQMFEGEMLPTPLQKYLFLLTRMQKAYSGSDLFSIRELQI